MKKLLVITSTTAKLLDGKPKLSRVFREGMQFYCENWGSTVSALVKLGDKEPTYGTIYDRDELPFDLILHRDEDRINRELLSQFDVVLCSGDNHDFLHLSKICQTLPTRIVFIIEYTFETRRQIVFLDPKRSLPRKLYSLAWNIWQEYRRRSAFRQADGLQTNGYPAMQAYGGLNSNPLLYLDNRFTREMLATEDEMKVRIDRLRSGSHVRLLHSGRLEHMKGSQDLVPIARQLRDKGLAFELNIFGAGSLSEDISSGIKTNKLDDCVHLHGPVDFASELVPFARSHADLFLSCHRQSDPSCTYLENMACGLPVVGYDNRMWGELKKRSDAGWVAPLGNWMALADQVQRAAQDPEEIISKSRKGFEFAGNHLFDQEFGSRIEHLKSLD